MWLSFLSKRRFWFSLQLLLVCIYVSVSVAIGLSLVGNGNKDGNPEGANPTALLQQGSKSSAPCRGDSYKTTKARNSDENSGPVVDLKAPPMGFMSWERFRCKTDCQAYPHDCIDETLYKSMADAMTNKGLVAAGYTQVSIDDCWVDKQNGRDSITNKLRPDATRFPSGMKALGDYLHSKGMRFGIYSDAGIKTCGGYEGSYGHAQIDAETFADWGVDYVKLDGCWITLDAIINPHAPFEDAYTAFGNALRNVSRPMVYSCSWPAYIGEDESKKPFDVMYEKSACNLWRNWADIDNSWQSLYKIIMHWAKNWKALQQVPDGSFNDADMLLVGDDHYADKGVSVLTLDQSRIQMGFWAMIGSPLMIGGDVRSMEQAFVDILTNPHAIAINQDPSRRQADCIQGCDTGGNPRQVPGNRRALGKLSNIQVWSKKLEFGKSHALAFFNFNEQNTIPLIQVSYALEGVVARCVDIWSGNPEEDICSDGKGKKTEFWDIQPIEDSSTNRNVLQITARNVAQTSHRMLRIDYLCQEEENE